MSEQQRAAVALARAGDLCLRAGPGAGKTSMLCEIYKALRALEREVVVISYSNASANAFNERLGETVATTMHVFCMQRLGIQAPLNDVFREALRVLGTREALPPGRPTSILVDEAQDCNADINRLLHVLRTKGYHVVYVGDAQQSIYGFMGASPGEFLGLQGAADMASFDLTENWRSTAALTHYFNRFSERNFEQPLRQTAVQGGAGAPQPFEACYDSKAELYGYVAGIQRSRPMLSALLVLNNEGLDEAHVSLFKEGAACITFSAARSEESRRVPAELVRPDIAQGLTIWGSKGREYARVFLLGCEDKGDANEHLERARCIFVGMTRATTELHLCSVRRPGAPDFSRFLVSLASAGEAPAAGGSACRAAFLQVRRVSETYGNEIVQAVLGDGAGDFFADEVLDLGSGIRGPDPNMTRLGLETAHGIIVEEHCRRALAADADAAGVAGRQQQARRYLTALHLPGGHPAGSRLQTIRSACQGISRWRAFAFKNATVLQECIAGRPGRLHWSAKAGETQAQRDACEDFVQLLCDLAQEQPYHQSLLQQSIALLTPLQPLRYADIFQIVRADGHLDAPNFAQARAAVLAALANDSGGPVSSLAALGLALVKKWDNGQLYEDMAVLRALTHLHPPPGWPAGLDLTAADMELGPGDAANVRQQAAAMKARGWHLAPPSRPTKKKYLGRETQLCGEPDLHGPGFVAEVKDVQKLTVSHACQAVLYAAMTDEPEALLWDVRRGKCYRYALDEVKRRALLLAVLQFAKPEGPHRPPSPPAVRRRLGTAEA